MGKKTANYKSNSDDEKTEKKIDGTGGSSTPKNIVIKCKNQEQKDFIKLIDSNEIILCNGPAGCGKAQPLYSKIYTPNGPITMGEIKIGQEICGVNGDIIKVTNIFPQGLKDCYRVTFTDNVFVDCCDEHLWKVSTSKNRDNYKKDVYDILKTKDMINNLIINRDGRRNYKLPIIKPIYYNDNILPIDSYLLGVLLGDGAMTQNSTSFSSVDSEIINLINEIVKNYNLKVNPTKSTLNGNGCTYLISGKKNHKNYVTEETRKMNIRCKSEFKFIPKEYLYSSIENRIKLLNGLMDTDGTVRKDSGCPTFSTSSKQLCDDFCELIRSLGGITNISIKKTKKLDNYVISINLPNEISPFNLSRKKELVKDKTKYLTPRYIKSIDYIGKVEQQCITVDSEDELYVTDNHVITHNTHISIMKALNYLKEDNNYKKIYIITPAVDVSKSTGFLPGNLMDKMSVYINSIYRLFDKIIGEKNRKMMVDKGIIETLGLNYIRGDNFDNCILIVDEAQNTTIKEMLTILTRISENCKMILSGDLMQIDKLPSKEESGLYHAMKKLENIENIGVFTFSEDSIVRNGIITKILKNWY